MSDFTELNEEDLLKPYEDIEKNEPDEKPDDNNYRLNNYGIDFDVNGIVRRLKNKSIYLPDFQRNYVWSLKKASKFIESLLLGLPVPGIFLYKESDQKMLIIDGFQRLETLKMYYSGIFGKKAFLLTDVFKDLNGLSYEKLPEDYKRKLDDTLLHSTIVKADDPKEKNYNAIYMIFERLNTGGVNLSPQEIRNCVSHGEFQKRLVLLSEDSIVKNILRIDPKRKKDQEIVLRLIALAFNHKNYTGNMKQYLNNFMFDNKDLKNRTVLEIIEEFIHVCTVMNEIRIDDIIRPNASLNIAILDSIWVGIYKLIESGSPISKAIIESKIQTLLDNSGFKDAILTGKTHHTDSVINRINISISEFMK